MFEPLNCQEFEARAVILKVRAPVGVKGFRSVQTLASCWRSDSSSNGSCSFSHLPCRPV